MAGSHRGHFIFCEQLVARADDPIYRQIVSAFQNHLEAVEVMVGEFSREQSTGAEFARGLELARTANDLMLEAHNQAMVHIQAMGRVSCIFCSQENERGSERCSKCGRNLPPTADEPERSSFAAVNAGGLEGGGPKGSEVTDNYVEVARALQAWRQDQLDADGLLAVLEAVEQRSRQHQADLVQQREMIELAPEEAREALHRGLDQTEAGLVETLAALEKMKLAFIKEDDTYLETGLHDLEKASRTMVQAFHTARAAATLPS
ncbi:hypothetical protein DYH09_09660 [bacterium CPR1]|nr:hypothetical protein [bacterium CPR1]